MVTVLAISAGVVGAIVFVLWGLPAMSARAAKRRHERMRAEARRDERPRDR